MLVSPSRAKPVRSCSVCMCVRQQTGVPQMHHSFARFGVLSFTRLKRCALASYRSGRQARVTRAYMNVHSVLHAGLAVAVRVAAAERTRADPVRGTRHVNVGVEEAGPWPCCAGHAGVGDSSNDAAVLGSRTALGSALACVVLLLTGNMARGLQLLGLSVTLVLSRSVCGTPRLQLLGAYRGLTGC